MMTPAAITIELWKLAYQTIVEHDDIEDAWSDYCTETKSRYDHESEEYGINLAGYTRLATDAFEQAKLDHMTDAGTGEDDDDPDGFEQVGTVRVDTGTLLIVDPAHADKASVAFEVAQRTDEAGHEHEYDGVLTLGPAVTIETGIGDGFYPVLVRYESIKVGDQPMGRRIAELRIQFWPHPAFTKKPGT
jgi:hypothetical protein